MKKNLVLFAFLILGISFTTFAKKVDISNARLTARNIYYEQINRHDAVPFESIAITGEFIENYNNHDVYYIFNINDKGFVIVSADDICYPVIGFSFETIYSPSDQAEGFIFWMNERKTEIAWNIENNLQPDVNTTATWQRYLTKDASQVLNGNKAIMDVTPMITSNWDQGFPYNSLVPADPVCSAFNGHATTGCVATAMAQIMYYWRWPNTGVGSHCDIFNNYGSLCANFGATTYDWNGMSNQPSKENNPIATIMYHAGIAVNMHYNSDGQCSSGAYTSDVGNALKNYFRYASSASYVKKLSYSTSSWNSLLQGDLNAGQPLNYAGQGPGGGHSWVCDGYQATDYYHFNWGWSGSSNGYYYLTNLNPGGYTFNSSQEAIVHITPDPAQYPTFCSGTSNVTTYDYGTVEDGSGPVAEYNNNSNCSWLIAPDDSVSSIRLTFIRFNTDPADVLTVYDGPNASSPVLGTFSGATTPTQTLNSTGPEMFVTFVSNGSVTAPGFLLSYETIPVTFCASTTTLTDVSGTFSDYSGRFEYRNGTTCKWIIQPPNATSITVTFDNFKTEATNDKTQIYNIAVNPPVLLAEYSGDHLASPLAPVTANSGKMMVMWTSNKTIRGDGWDASYSVTVGTNEQKAFEDFSIFPNPTSGLLNVHFTMNEVQSVRIEVLSLKGELVYSQNYGSVSGSFDKQIDLSSLAKGVYILKMTSDQGITNNKIVVQ
ncbi:MAG: C10 family peptidase [Bacteroidetes bacterium]|nr:C10 family peptidase [Bacteroidota bacterium]